MGRDKELEKAKENKQPLPLGQRVMVKKEETTKKDKKTPSGIILPESAKVEEEGNAGKILALSPHLPAEWTNLLNVGDSILYSKINNDEVKMGGEVFILIPTENILGKLP